jgi:pimeloyl-[acyl-carrier protein] methyl ester esterase
MKKHFVFCHGWGFDNNFWQPLLSYFDPKITSLWNLGYIGERNIALPINGNQHLIGIAHSFGLINFIPFAHHFSAIIGLQSFINFLGNDSIIYNKQKIKWQIMLNRFTENPEKTLQMFYKKSGTDFNQIEYKLINIQRLKEDLIAMSQNYHLPNLPILIIANKNDKIITLDLIKDNFTQNNIKLIVNPFEGHSLKSQNTDLIYEQIMSFLNEIL